jgi:hypothetical protein
MIERKFFFLVSVCLISLTFSGIGYLQGLPFLSVGPPLYTAEVTQSLWHTHSLRPERFDQIYREASDLSRTAGAEVWQDVFALDRRGGLAPKHALLSSVIAVPFYAIFGKLGFWVLQQLLFVWLLYSLYAIATRLAGRSLPLTTIVVSMILSPLLLHSHGFSSELHGCALVLGGLNMIHRRQFFGAFLMSLSILVRPSYILLVIPLVCAVYRHTPEWHREILRRSVGVAFGLGIVFMLNYILWGDSFATAYQRLPSFRNGELFISTHPVGFDLETFLSDWPAKLWGETGVFPVTSCLFLLPLVVISLRHQRDRWFEGVCLSTALLYTLYIFSYQMWMVTGPGNRFLLTATCLCIPSCIAFLARVVPEARDVHPAHSRRQKSTV